MLKSTIVGTVGKATFTKSGDTKVLTFSVASNEFRGEKKYTNWVQAKIWGDRAEKVRDIVKKGRHVWVSGRPEATAFAKADGTPAATLVLHVDDFGLIGPNPEGAKKPAEPAKKKS